MVVVDLYPFKETVAKNENENEIIEKIDIGGVSLIRAAAKNFSDVLIVSCRSQYETTLDYLVKINFLLTINLEKEWLLVRFQLSKNMMQKLKNILV